MESQRTEKIKKAWAKVSNFWYYEKWKVLLFSFLIVLAVYGINQALTQKETAFSGALLNCVPKTESSLAEAFAQYEGLDTDTYEVVFQDNISLAEEYSSNNMMTLESLFAQINAGDLDFLAATPDIFQTFAYNTSEVFPDLRKYLDEETMERLSGQIYYMDKAFLSTVQDAVGSEEAYNALEYPDPYRPEEMEEPVPVGIDISKCPKIQEAYGFGGASLYLGIIDNTEQPETVVRFIKFILE